MLLIKIPNNFIQERKYIVSIIFGEFLGINYKLEISNCLKDYEITLPNKKKLIIKDQFFSKYNENEGYLNKKNLPKIINYFSNKFLLTKTPILFGNSKIYISKNEIICYQDIFASSFFMLSRWEEHVLLNGARIPAKESLAYKFDFLNQPIVDDYTDYLWKLLTYLRFKEKRKKTPFKFILTHDIDNPLKYYSLRNKVSNLVKDIFKSKFDFKSSTNNEDPYDKFDYLMGLSEDINAKSLFFVLAPNKLSKYEHYLITDKQINSIIKKIRSRGHIIGLHSSYQSYNNEKLWCEEYNRLSQKMKKSIDYGRQHHLNFNIPITWQIQEDCGLKKDFSVGYAEKEGFRCGTCKEYSVFNILTREKLKLKEIPLIVMESTFVSYQKLNPKETDKKIRNLISTVKKHNGNFVFLWHNSCLSGKPWEEYTPIFTKIILKNGK